MSVEWMGRYRPLVAALVRHSNLNAKLQFQRSDVGEGVMLSAQEWQILEYILEHRYETANMITISDTLGIAQSTFSKAVKYLCEQELVEKYQAANNRKNVILMPTAKAESIYSEHSKIIFDSVFGKFFETLDCMDDNMIDIFVRALTDMNDALDPKLQPTEVELIKKE